MQEHFFSEKKKPNYLLLFLAKINKNFPKTKKFSSQIHYFNLAINAALNVICFSVY
jgi:hypothetical protein